MQNHMFVALVALSTLVACDEEKDESIDREPVTGDVDDGLADEEMMNAPFELDADWGQSALTFEIYGGLGDDFECGIAETGAAEAADNYVDESCIMSPYCHPCGKTGVTLTYNGNPDDLAEGVETAFSSAGDEPTVTYYVYNRNTQVCYIWGHSVSYYRVTLDQDCEIYTPIAATE